MAYGVVNRSGCTERYGLVQVRLDLCLEAGEVRWNDLRFYQVDQTSKAYLRGYRGKLDELGLPVDLEAFAAWESSLPRIWLPERCFHSHFIYLDPYTLRDEQITSAIGLHLPNFYAAWCAEWDKVAGGMRHGWDVATRVRPQRFNKTQPELYVARKAECLSKLPILSSFAAHVVGEGETFPSTDIDIGDEAINRSHYTDILTTTKVSAGNPANATGNIDTIEIWLNDYYSDGKAVWSGTFSASGNTLTCRDSQNMGAIVRGSKKTITDLDISVNSGDYIGVKERSSATTVGLEVSIEGAGYWSYTGECIDASDSQTFGWTASRAFSLYGTGETVSIVEVGDEAEDIGDEMLRRGRMVLMGSGVRGHP